MLPSAWKTSKRSFCRDRGVALERRRYPAPEARARRRHPGDGRERGLRHRRAPLSRSPFGVAVPDHSRPRQRGTGARDRRTRCTTSEGRPDRGRDAGHLLRRLPHLRPVLALPGRPGRARAVRTARCTASPQRRRGVAGRLGRADRAEAGGARAAPAGDVSAEDFMGGGCGLPTGFHAVERAGSPLETPWWCRGAGRSA